MTPRPVDVGSVQAKLRSLDELGSALRLVGEADGARLEQDVLLRLAVERALTQTVVATGRSEWSRSASDSCATG